MSKRSAFKATNSKTYGEVFNISSDLIEDVIDRFDHRNEETTVAVNTNYLINVNQHQQPSIETHYSEMDTSHALLPSIESIVHDPMPADELKLLTTTKTNQK